MSPVIAVSTATLLARRDELLRTIGLSTYDEFRTRSRDAVLTDTEWQVRDELDSVAYLLGENELSD